MRASIVLGIVALAASSLPAQVPRAIGQPTDHGWPDQRIALESAVITWLARR